MTDQSSAITKSTTDIVAMQEEVRLWIIEKGWDQDERSFGDELMLIVSEASEALEAFRLRGFEEHNVPVVRGSVFREPEQDSGELTKPDDVASEIADILIRLFDTCDRHGFDLGYEFRRKMDYNWTRTYRYGGKLL